MKKLQREFAGQAVITSSPSAWMTEECMLEYVDKIIGANMFGKRRLLAMDTYTTHLCESVKRKLRNRHVDISYIPGGCTAYIQAPDVVWNKPFKDYCTEQYSAWFLKEGLESVTRQGNLKAPPRKEIVGWILAAWKQLSQEVIADSFKKCGLTSDETNYREITCFQKPSCAGGIEMLGAAITLNERNVGEPL